MIKFVPGVGWVDDSRTDSQGSPVALNGSEEKARQDAYFAAQNSWRDGIGNYEPYADGTIADLSSLLDGDKWWYARLHHMANEVGQGDQDWFLREFSGRENRGQAREMINRFLALQQQGYSDDEIMRGIYGDSWGAGGSKGAHGASPPPTGSGPAPPQAPGPVPGHPPGGFLPQIPRERRKGTWGSGYSNGGYDSKEPDPGPGTPNPGPGTPNPGPGGESPSPGGEWPTPNHAPGIPYEDRLWPTPPNQRPFPNKGEGMFSPQSEQMRRTIVSALEKKLLG